MCLNSYFVLDPCPPQALCSSPSRIDCLDQSMAVSGRFDFLLDQHGTLSADLCLKLPQGVWGPTAFHATGVVIDTEERAITLVLPPLLPALGPQRDPAPPNP